MALSRFVAIRFYLAIIVILAGTVLWTVAARALVDGEEQIEPLLAFDNESDLRLGYAELDRVYSTIVYDVGRSDRTKPTRPENFTGSRLKRQNKGRYRLEGNRISFNFQNDKFPQLMTRVRRNLEAAATTAPLQDLSRQEQLAYWLNLHNVAVIEQLAHAYPVANTRNIKIDKLGFFDAPVVTVAGTALSLNDIRFKIVFANYDRPEVIYGFFLGNIGGPNIQKRSYYGGTVYGQLEENAREFVNSLRGVENSNRRIRVSRIYEDGRRYFPDWPGDLKSHLRRYGDADVDQILAQGGDVKADVYDWTIADLSYGDASEPIGNVLSADRESGGSFRQVGVARMSAQTREFVAKVEQRRLKLFQERGADVMISDIETEDRADAAADGSESPAPTVDEGEIDEEEGADLSSDPQGSSN